MKLKLFEEFEEQHSKHNDYHQITGKQFGIETMGWDEAGGAYCSLDDIVFEDEGDVPLSERIKFIKERWEEFTDDEIYKIRSLYPYDMVIIKPAVDKSYFSSELAEDEKAIVPEGAYVKPGCDFMPGCRIDIEQENIQIVKLIDEWYYVKTKMALPTSKHTTNIIAKYKQTVFYYKCDQFNGLMSFLRKNL